MATTIELTGTPVEAVDPLAESDAREVMAAVIARRPVDPEVARRVRERSDAIADVIYQKHGYLDVIEDLIREVREE